MSHTLKSAVQFCGQDPRRFDTHSFRIGRASQLAADNASDLTIRATGRWKSNAFLEYIRPHSVILPPWVNVYSTPFLPQLSLLSGAATSTWTAALEENWPQDYPDEVPFVVTAGAMAWRPRGPPYALSVIDREYRGTVLSAS